MSLGPALFVIVFWLILQLKTSDLKQFKTTFDSNAIRTVSAAIVFRNITNVSLTIIQIRMESIHI